MLLKYFFIIIIFFTLTSKACEKPTMPSESEWNNWLDDVRKEAIDNGISIQTIDLHLSDVKPQKKNYLKRQMSTGVYNNTKRVFVLQGR